VQSDQTRVALAAAMQEGRTDLSDTQRSIIIIRIIIRIIIKITQIYRVPANCCCQVPTRYTKIGRAKEGHDMIRAVSRWLSESSGLRAGGDVDPAAHLERHRNLVQAC